MSFRKKELNDYEIDGKVTKLRLNSKGEKVEVLIDTEDLPKLKELNKHWTLGMGDKDGTTSRYAVTGFYLGIEDEPSKQKRKSLSLQHFLEPIEPGQLVDHKNHNTLDYRRENLRIVSSSQNTRNRKGKNSNNTSGYRNVSLIGGFWRVQLQRDGKNVLFPEKFEDVDEAGAFAKKKRAEFYGEFAGNG